ncbi:MAG: hypothetical protein JJT95_13330 [Pararhodobacter sp.]|nr:hypothetical protein [Pararhodobacter sp.]
MFRLVIATVGALAFGSTAADAWTRITTEDQYRAQVADREQVDNEGRGRVTFHSDGRVTGEWQGQPIRGAWQWHQGFLCRNLIIGSHETGTNCLLSEIRGDQVRGTQDQGRGNVTVTTLR